MSDIVLQHVTKRYGNVTAVDNVSFTVEGGICFGLLGPNGAGKTTTIEIMEGILPPTSGEVLYRGERVGRRFREEAGILFQKTALQDFLTVRQTLVLFRGLYERGLGVDEVIRLCSLEKLADRDNRKLSGGQQQRLLLAIALVNDPAVLFLDEPTTGLDPQARHEIHALIAELRREQRSILMTTHYIEEAEKLCDRVAIIDEGRIVAMGTPREIQARALGESSIEIRSERPLPNGECRWRDCAAPVFSDDRRRMVVQSTRPARTLVDLVKWIEEHGVDLSDIHLKRPTLEDAFIELTGKSLRE